MKVMPVTVWLPVVILVAPVVLGAAIGMLMSWHDNRRYR